MSRNTKPGISFYRVDTGHIINKKVRLLCNEFDSDGYFIWSCLVDHAYMINGYYFDNNDKEGLELFASEYCKKKLPLVKEVIAGCLRRDLFDKDVFEMFGILTSEMMQEVFIYATSDRRKKGSVFQMQEDWLLIDFKGVFPSNIEIVPGKKDKNPVKITQTKQNPNNTKTKTTQDKKSLPASQAPLATEDVEPFWKLLVDVWFSFGKDKFGEEPSFAGQDPKVFKRIIGLLKKRAAAKNVEWNEANSVERLKSFLNAAFADTWLCKHFLLLNLEKQFDQIIQQQTEASKKKEVGATPKKTLEPWQRDLNFLLGRYNESPDDFQLIIIEVATYETLKRKKFFDNLNEDALPDLRVRAIEYLKLNNKKMDEETIERTIKRICVLELIKYWASEGKTVVYVEGN